MYREFGVAKKSKKSHEKGNMSFVLKVQSTTIVTVIEGSAKNEFIPKFYHFDSIAEFYKHSHEVWTSGTIAAFVIDIRGTYLGLHGKLHQIVLVDGCTKYNHDTLVFSDNFQGEYNQIVEAFNSRQCVMALFKNISTIQIGDWYFVMRCYNIISTIVDDFFHMQLQVIHKKISNKAPTSRERYFFHN